MLNKNFFIGLGVGVALTMVVLDMWGRYLDERIMVGANPWLVQPFRQRQHPVLHMPKTSDRLPRPVLPVTASAVHDHWIIRPPGGKGAKLGDFKGKVVFLNFWSTTCAPCIAEMPGIERLQESLEGEPVAFLIVAQEDEQAVRSFLQKVPLRLPVYLADNDIPEDLRPEIVPRTFILDRNGSVVYRDVGAANWDDENARKFLRGLEAR